MTELESKLLAVIEKNKEKEIVIAGTTGAALVVYSWLMHYKKDVKYFLNANDLLNVKHRLTKRFGKDVYPVQQLLFEDLDRIVVINAFAYKDMLEDMFQRFGMVENEHYFNLDNLLKVKKGDCFDPLLGYTRIGNPTGFSVYGDGEGMRIVCLGGSTTDATFSDIESWPRLLHQKLNSKGRKNTVYNGGIYGYTSCQERDKFLRDVLCFKPDIVISFSGFNDINWTNINPNYPYYSSFCSDMAKEHAKQEPLPLSLGVSHETKDYENWFHNQKIMHAVAEAFGIRFLTFLQPALLLSGELIQTQAWLTDYIENIVLENNTRKRVYEGIHDFYNGARRLMQGEKDMFDASELFVSKEEVFLDLVHCDRRGNCRIADALCEYL